MSKKKPNCQSCIDLTARLERLEARLDSAEKQSDHWHKRWGIVDNELRIANGRISLLESENVRLKKIIEKKDAQIGHLQKMLFSSKTEVSEPPTAIGLESWEADAPKKPLGKQPGSKGFGRKIRHDLPTEQFTHDVSTRNKSCLVCGKKRNLTPFTEDSEEIHYSYKLIRIQHKRLKYRKTCQCKNTKTIVTAKPVNKLIPKGLFSVDFWNHVLLEKFLLQRPLSRICLSFGLQGLSVSESTLSSGLQKLTKIFAPLYNSLRKCSKQSIHWQMDETHWKVFTDLMGKTNHQWWLWVVETKNTTVFVLDPSRSSQVPVKYLANISEGIVTCDRYSAYQPLKNSGIQLSYCWSHVRRDFLNLRNGYPQLTSFANKWIKTIDRLFYLNKQRNNQPKAQQEIVILCQQMEKDCHKQLKRTALHDEAKAVLTSLKKHWLGLTLFVKYPNIPMDNNAAERALRNPVIGRKNYYGSRSIWSGQLSAMLFSLFATLRKHQLDPYKYLGNYLHACANNQGRPPTDLTPFLPWLAKSIPFQSTA